MPMRIPLLRTLFICLFAQLIFVGSAFSTHLMGGDLTYKALGNNKIELRFMVYRDCISSGSAALDQSITYRIYQASYTASSNYTKYVSRTIKLYNSKKVNPEAPRCNPPTGVCVQLGVYIDTITLGATVLLDTVGFQVVWMRDFRNYLAPITNLAKGSCFFSSNPGNPYGSVWYTFIPPVKITNNTPQFLTNPIPYICAGRKSMFNPNVSDPDKDSLVFSLETPYSPKANCTSSGFPTPVPPGHPDFKTVTYASGFSASNPFGTGSSITINSTTGEITVYAANTGNYVMAIQIKEYRVNPVTRQATLVGEIRRDLQFVVGSCSTSNSYPQFAKDTLGLTRYVNPGDTLSFEVQAASASDSIFMDKTGGIFVEHPTIAPPYAKFTGTLSGHKKATGKFFWVPTCDHITYTTPHIVTFSASDEHCNTIYSTYSIYVRSRAIYLPPKIKCVSIVGADSVRISLLDSGKKADFFQYKLYRDTGLSGNFMAIDSSSKLNRGTWSDKKAFGTAKTIYRYYVTTQNSCGLEGLPSDTVSTILTTATAISDKTGIISWNPQRSQLKRYYKVYANTGSGFQMVDSTLKNSIQVAACRRNAVYQVRVSDSAGTCISMGSTSKALLLTDHTGPALNGKLKNVSIIAQDSIEVTFGQADTADIRYYIIQRSSNGGSFSTIDTVEAKDVAATGAHYVDTRKLNTANYSYCYRLIGVDSCGNIGKTAESHCSVLLKGTNGQREAFLNWNKYRGYTADTIVVQKLIAGKWVDHKKLTVNDSSYNEKPLLCGVEVKYRIKYKKGGADFSAFSNVAAVTPFDTVKPAKVQSLYSMLNNNGTVLISWQASADKDVKHYVIQRRINPSGNWQTLSTLETGLQFIDADTAVKRNQYSYGYRIFAVDSCGNNMSVPSDIVSTTLLKRSITKCKQEVTLNIASYVDGSQVLTGYDIYRKRQSESSYSLIASVGNVSSYVDKLAGNTEDVSYFVAPKFTGISASLRSNYTDTFRLFRPGAPELLSASVGTTSASAGDVQLAWKSMSGRPNISGVAIYHRTSTGNWNLVHTASPSSSGYTVSNLNTTSALNYFRLVAVDSCGNYGDSSAIHRAINLTMTVGQLYHSLRWTSYKGFSVDKYVIQRYIGSQYVAVDTVAGTDTLKLFFPAPCNTVVRYRVQAISFDNVTSNSNYVVGQALDTVPANPPVIINATNQPHNHNTIRYKGSDSADVFGYAIERKKGGNSLWSAIDFKYYGGPGKEYVFTDPEATAETVFCYRVVTLDSCLNRTVSSVFCPINLNAAAGNQSAKLSFSRFRGFPVKSYRLESYRGGKWLPLKSGITPGDTAFTLADLPCNIPMSLRVMAEELDGGRYSVSDSVQIIPFDTIVPQAPLLSLATVENNKALLRWKGFDKDVKLYTIYKRVNNSAYTIAGTSSKDSFVDNSFNPAQRTDYYLTATDSCDASHISKTSNPGNIISLKTATFLCKPAVTLNFTNYAGNADAGPYKIQRSTDGVAFSTIATAGAAGAFTDTAVDTSVVYYYRVCKGTLTAGDAWSAVQKIKPGLFSTPPRVNLHNASVVSTGVAGSVSLSWRPRAAQDTLTKGYRLYSAVNYAGPYILLATISHPGTTTYLHTGVNTLAGPRYYFISPYNNCGIGAPAVDTHRVVLLNVSTENAANNLKWTAYQGRPVNEYAIERSDNGGAFYAKYRIPGNDTFFIDLNVSCGKTYRYRVTALDSTSSLQNGALSNMVTVTTVDNIAPDTAQILFVTVDESSGSKGRIEVVFNAGQERNIKSYLLYRSAGGPFLLYDSIKSTSQSVLRYVDANVSVTKQAYKYYLRAKDSCGNTGAASKPHTSILLKVSPLNKRIELTWSPYEGFDKFSYQIERRTINSPWQAIGAVSSDSILTFSDANVYCNILYEYRVKAVEGAAGLTSISNMDAGKAVELVPPDKATLLNAGIASTNEYTGSVGLRWLPAGASDLKGYVIFKKNLTSGTGWQAAAVVDRTITNYELTGLNTYRNQYRFRVLAQDSCGNLSNESQAEVFSPVNLKAIPGNESIRLTWTEFEGYASLREYNIYRDGVQIASVLPNVTSLVDTHRSCLKIYTYRVQAVGKDTFSFSNYDSARPYDRHLPDAPKTLGASMTEFNSQVTVRWARSGNWDAKTYKLYRRSNSNRNTLIYSTNNLSDTSYIDNIEVDAKGFCYTVTVTDSCGNEGEAGLEACTFPIRVVAGNQYNTITWNTYKNWDGGSSGQIVYRKINNGMWEPLAQLQGVNHAFVDKDIPDLAENICYYVEDVSADTLYKSAVNSIMACVVQQPLVHIPNAFTPKYSINLNDEFGPKGLYIANFNMTILNRWGERVFETTSGKHWDGKFKGEYAPAGMYRYSIEIISWDGKRLRYSGNVWLLE